MKDRNQKVIVLAGKFGISATHALTSLQSYSGNIDMNEEQFKALCGAPVLAMAA